MSVKGTVGTPRAAGAPTTAFASGAPSAATITGVTGTAAGTPATGSQYTNVAGGVGARVYYFFGGAWIALSAP